jgi:hypothetical protein
MFPVCQPIACRLRGDPPVMCHAITAPSPAGTPAGRAARRFINEQGRELDRVVFSRAAGEVLHRM